VEIVGGAVVEGKNEASTEISGKPPPVHPDLKVVNSHGA